MVSGPLLSFPYLYKGGERMLSLNSPGKAELSSGLRFWAGSRSGEPGPE